MKNNILSSKSVEVRGSDNTTREEQNTFEYNAKNYPTKVTVKTTDSSDANSRQETYTFEYIEYKK